MSKKKYKKALKTLEDIFTTLEDIGVLGEFEDGLNIRAFVGELDGYPEDLDTENFYMDGQESGIYVDEREDKVSVVFSGTSGGDWQDPTRWNVVLDEDGARFQMYDGPECWTAGEKVTEKQFLDLWRETMDPDKKDEKKKKSKKESVLKEDTSLYTDLYCEGYDNYLDGFKANQNPWKRGTPEQAKAWLSGWNQASIDMAVADEVF